MVQSQFKIHPINNSKGGRQCKSCSNKRALIRKYGLNICRRCFREQAPTLGFSKMH